MYDKILQIQPNYWHCMSINDDLLTSKAVGKNSEVYWEESTMRKCMS